jgi:hypothetical protein
VTALTINRLAQRDTEAMINRVVGNNPLPASLRQDIACVSAWPSLGLALAATWILGGSVTKSNAALSLRADNDPVLAAIELTANAWQRFVAGRAREPKDADGKPAILTPAYARWQAAQDDICQSAETWDRRPGPFFLPAAATDRLPATKRGRVTVFIWTPGYFCTSVTRSCTNVTARSSVSGMVMVTSIQMPIG